MGSCLQASACGAEIKTKCIKSASAAHWTLCKDELQYPEFWAWIFFKWTVVTWVRARDDRAAGEVTVCPVLA